MTALDSNSTAIAINRQETAQNADGRSRDGRQASGGMAMMQRAAREPCARLSHRSPSAFLPRLPCLPFGASAAGNLLHRGWLLSLPARRSQGPAPANCQTFLTLATLVRCSARADAPSIPPVLKPLGTAAGAVQVAAGDKCCRHIPPPPTTRLANPHYPRQGCTPRITPELLATGPPRIPVSLV